MTKFVVPFDSDEIKDGDKVILNVKKIMKRKECERFKRQYKNFVEDNKDKVFTAHIERTGLISFQENPKWFFHYSDLLKLIEEE